MNFINMPKIKIEVPTTIASNISSLLFARIAAKHPNPPPTIVPIPRYIPLLSVAPDQIVMKADNVNFIHKTQMKGIQ